MYLECDTINYNISIHAWSNNAGGSNENLAYSALCFRNGFDLLTYL